MRQKPPGELLADCTRLALGLAPVLVHVALCAAAEKRSGFSSWSEKSTTASTTGPISPSSPSSACLATAGLHSQECTRVRSLLLAVTGTRHSGGGAEKVPRWTFAFGFSCATAGAPLPILPHTADDRKVNRQAFQEKPKPTANRPPQFIVRDCNTSFPSLCGIMLSVQLR